ncbi:MAG: threonine-phosphate decarboxylase [Acidobacteria bacterium]|nr:MAG: threonine-phosphate decarboxylase [Acidobacteriota bacterium]PIE90974.1 MAG: threonine-phosphate decarboxylase [Acidobacteriota bacterium]
MSGEYRPFKHALSSLNACVHGGLIQQCSQKYGIPEAKILDASASLNPCGTPFDDASLNINLQKLLLLAMEKLGQYPDNRYLEFRQAAARYLGRGMSYENIVPGNGSTEIIRLVAECVLNNGDTVLVPRPTFSEYEQQSRLMGADIRMIEQDDLHNLDDNLLAESQMLFVCNPNNPTGQLFPREQLEKLANRCTRQKTLLFVDEAFIELADPSQSIVKLVEDHHYLVIQRSLTKAFAIPGIRMGFAVASPRLANTLNRARLSWNMGCVAETIAIALLSMEGGENSPFLVNSRTFIEQERQFLTGQLANQGVKVHNSSANYLYLDISELQLNAIELAELMASRGVLIRDCSSFQHSGVNHLRIAIRKRAENRRLVQTFQQVIDEGISLRTKSQEGRR